MVHVVGVSGERMLHHFSGNCSLPCRTCVQSWPRSGVDHVVVRGGCDKVSDTTLPQASTRPEVLAGDPRGSELGQRDFDPPHDTAPCCCTHSF